MAESPTASGPLAGLRVLDLASLYAGPLLATLLADLGADVVKIEPPDGDLYRRAHDPLWSICGRNKRSVTLDVRAPTGRAILHRLLTHVDVLVENLPENLRAELGVTPDLLATTHPRLVVASVTGFGRTGPYRDRLGSGTLGEAFAGLTDMTGDADGPPTLSSVPLGDAVTALCGAFGALAALYRRDVGGGRGQQVDISTWESVLVLLGPVIAALRDDQPPPTRSGSRLAGAPVRNVYRTRDDRYVAISCGSPRQLTDVAGLVGREQDGEDLDSALAAWIAARDLDDVATTLLEQRVPVVPVNDAAQLMNDPHVIARHAVTTVHSAELGATRAVAAAPRFSATPPNPRDTCPQLGEHNADVYGGWLGLSHDELHELSDQDVI